MKKIHSCFLIALLFLTLGCTVINPIRSSPYRTFKSNIRGMPFDVIIVPGVPYHGETWSKTMRYRVLWSKFLIDKGYANNVIYSGSAVYSPFVESKIMALYGKELGIPEQNIFTEEKAEHSTENLFYSYEIAKQMGFIKIALATDPFQINNLRQYISKNNYDLTLLPLVVDSVIIMDQTEPNIINTSALVDTATFVSIKDRESILKRLGGTMGRNLPKRYNR
mgnify:CR=1 FL=1